MLCGKGTEFLRKVFCQHFAYLFALVGANQTENFHNVHFGILEVSLALVYLQFATCKIGFFKFLCGVVHAVKSKRIGKFLPGGKFVFVRADVHQSAVNIKHVIFVHKMPPL